MPTQRFEARPTLENNGSVSWTLCHMNPSPPLCGDTKATYPDVTLGRNTGKHTFEFKITNDQTGLGIKFADEPLWIKKGTQPTGPGLDPQIETPNGKGTQSLTFVDKNSKPDKNDPAPIVLKYQLNFVDKDNKKVAEIDPDITNGGTSFVGYDQTTLLLAGIALFMLLGAVWFGIAAMRRKAAASGPAQDARQSSADQRNDVNTTGGDGI
jgi:hypothetical protein